MSLYPEIAPYRTDFFDTQDGHRIYFEESGNPSGKPVVFVHGGPGGGTQPDYRRFFDPNAYRIVLFDQRGCGKSEPFASLENNTTWHLVADMEQLRELLGIEKWQLFGGSWGSTLALAYAQKHPERVTEMVLRGIFLLRQAEIDWFYQEGCSWIYPDAFEAYRDLIPEGERGDFVQAYYRRLTSPDAAVRADAARTWSGWEGRTSRLIPDSDLISKTESPRFAEAFARIECHYFINNGFFEVDGQLLRDVPKIAHIPVVIVQGRYDVVCPAKSAWDLHSAWAGSELHLIPDSGHAAMERGTAAALVAATDKFRGI